VLYHYHIPSLIKQKLKLKSKLEHSNKTSESDTTIPEQPQQQQESLPSMKIGDLERTTISSLVLTSFDDRDSCRKCLDN
jgi:hypothetical protein